MISVKKLERSLDMSFKIGDFVVATCPQDTNENVVNQEGTIVVVDESWGGQLTYLVDFLKDVNGHKSGNLIKLHYIPPGHGWWMDEQNIEHAEIDLENV